MKKLVMLVFALSMGLSTFAESKSKDTSKLIVNFYKLDENRNISIETNTLSKKEKESICWDSFVPESMLGQQVNVLEVFRSSEPSHFSGEEIYKIKSSRDKKTWKIKKKLIATEKLWVYGCWRTTDDDPVGQYSLTLTIDGQKQKPVIYTVIE